jgi:radical SAM protein with 4Fe4S-binding SPASM domain
VVTQKAPKVRYESFGGILGLTDPPALVFVDQQYMRELGHTDSPLWLRASDHLSAPTEVHFNVTRRCPLSCRHCTTNASQTATTDELSTESVTQALRSLATMGVFHVAFGGGELFMRSDAIELARTTRQLGMIPNATTNGHVMSARLAQECRVFGQVNVSLDGVGDRYAIVRGSGDFEQADRTIRRLVEAGVSTGINCVVTRLNFPHLEEVVAHADALGLKEVLFLRLKPSGRAVDIYHELALTRDQGRRFFPVLQKLARRTSIALQADCSFIPHMCFHRPSKRAMRMLAVEGCGGGSQLLGVNESGQVNACSHCTEWVGAVHDLASFWDDHEHFRRFRERRVTDPRCTRCGYFDLCRGGCPLFATFLGGEFGAPDPECPMISG